MKRLAAAALLALCAVAAPNAADSARPTDIRSIDFLGAPAIAVDAMSFARNPTYGAGAFYPPKAKRNGVEGVVTLAGQVFIRTVKFSLTDS